MPTMSNSSAPADLVADALFRLDTEEERIEFMRLTACYCFGAIAALKGRKLAAELAYSMGDGLVEGAR